jgi:hypothetical protein
MIAAVGSDRGTDEMTPDDYAGLRRLRLDDPSSAGHGDRPYRLSRRNFLVLGGVTTAAAAIGLGSAPATYATTPQVDLDFESGSLGPPLTYYTGAAVAGAYAHTGSYGCRLNPTTTTHNLACLEVNRKGFALNLPYVTYSMWFRLVTHPRPTDTYMNLFEIGTTSAVSPKSQFTVYFKNNRLICDFNYDETMDLGPMPAIGEWHVIQAVVYYGSTTYTAQVSYDGAATLTLTSANDKTPETVAVLWIHYPTTAVDYTVDVDEIQMATSASKPDFLGTPPVPTPPPPPPPATQTFAESFEGGAVGTQPTSANTAYDQWLGSRGDGDGTIAASFDASGVRGHCARFYNTAIALNAFGFLGKRVNPQTVIYLRRYYLIDVLPTYRTSVLLYKYGGTGNGQLGGTHNGSFAFGGAAQSHKFTLVNNNTNSTLSRSTVPLNAWFRAEAELDFTSGTGIQTVRLFLGSNFNGTTPDETLTANLTGPYTDYLEDGILTNPNVKINVRIDEAANGTIWPGPVQ